MSSGSEDDFSAGDLGSSDGDDMSAECADEYSVDSDGNIKPDQDAPKIPKSMLSDKKDDKAAGLSAEERRKKKRLEKLDKRIKTVTKKHDKEKKIKVEPKLIKNKQKRQEVALMRKMENRRVAKIDKLKK